MRPAPQGGLERSRGSPLVRAAVLCDDARRAVVAEPFDAPDAGGTRVGSVIVFVAARMQELRSALRLPRRSPMRCEPSGSMRVW